MKKYLNALSLIYIHLPIPMDKITFSISIIIPTHVNELSFCD